MPGRRARRARAHVATTRSHPGRSGPLPPGAGSPGFRPAGADDPSDASQRQARDSGGARGHAVRRYIRSSLLLSDAIRTRILPPTGGHIRLNVAPGLDGQRQRISGKAS